MTAPFLANPAFGQHILPQSNKAQKAAHSVYMNESWRSQIVDFKENCTFFDKNNQFHDHSYITKQPNKGMLHIQLIILFFFGVFSD